MVFYSVFQQSDPQKVFQTLSPLTDEQWLDMLVRSVGQPEINGIQLPRFPEDQYQRESVGSAGEQTLREAYNFYREIKKYAIKLGLDLNPESKVLDFGCGWGRIIRFFLKDISAGNLYGVDVDPLMVEMCQKLVGYGKFSTVNPQPPTAFADESLDIIYAYSVFSHLSEPVHIKWIEEFSRILKPGGILLATTEARHFIEYCRSLQGTKFETKWHEGLAKAFPDTEKTLAEYDSGKFIFSGTGGGDVRPSTFYGEAVIPCAYVEREWTKYLAFKDFIDEKERFWQAVVIMQKPVVDLKAYQAAPKTFVQKIEGVQPSDPQKVLQTLSPLTDDQWLNVLVESVRKPVFGEIALPEFPPDTYQRESVGSAGEQTLKEAYNFYREIKKYALKLGLDLNPESKVLDFGCGWGRIIRFFLKDVLAGNLCGVDVDPLMIEMCQKLVGYGNFSTVNPQPPTAFADASLDIIYAYSVFSHLSEAVHIKWIEEFSRILKPGGILVATTEARHFIEYTRSLRGKKHETCWHEALAKAFPDIEATLAQYDRGQFIFSGTGGGESRPSTFYGEAVIPRAYIEREWTRYLAFKDFIDEKDRFWQAVVIMQRPLGVPASHTEEKGDLESLLKEKDFHIANLQALLAEKESALSSIYGSRGWKLLRTYYRIRDRILSR